MAGVKKGYILHTLVSFVPLDSAEKHTSELKKLCRHCCLKMVCQTWLVTLNVKEGVSTFDQLNSHIIWTCDKHMSLPIIKLLNNTSTGIPWIPWLNCYSLRFQSADEQSANQWSNTKLKNSWEVNLKPESEKNTLHYCLFTNWRSTRELIQCGQQKTLYLWKKESEEP